MFELLVLGTAAMTPTRTRNQNSHLLRWASEAILFDPGEGTQRQLLAAGASVAQVTRVCITHFHGDHCLGLPGVLQRRAVDLPPRPLHIHFPASGADRIARLIDATEWDTSTVDIRLHPAVDGTCIELGTDSTLLARALDHTVDALGWRVEQRARRHFVVSRLGELGIDGADIGRLRDQGWLDHHGRRIAFEDVSELRRGRCFAFVMDTRPCAAAVALARDADLLVCEATFAQSDAELAAIGGHLTAADAGRLAREAGARLLVLTHFSDRYDDISPLAEEARAEFPHVVAAADLSSIVVPAPGYG